MDSTMTVSRSEAVELEKGLYDVEIMLEMSKTGLVSVEHSNREIGNTAVDLMAGALTQLKELRGKLARQMAIQLE